MTKHRSAQTVDLCNWRFSFVGNPRFDGTAFERPVEIFEFQSAVDLLKHLGNDDSHQSAFQNRIRERLKSDLTAKQWHRQRTSIGSTKHFKSYRKNRRCQKYHDAAFAIANGHATPVQHALVEELNIEIASSHVVVPAGQILFHGRKDRNLETTRPYASFISTSLDPTVSVHHATKRIKQPADARATIYALTLKSQLHAMWGNGGKLIEWELLLKTQLMCTVTKVHKQGRFDIIEAYIR